MGKGIRGEQVSWVVGGGYDLLVSAYVLHRPREFGLPAPWAAGVRGRLTAENRTAFKFFFGGPAALGFFMPFQIVQALPGERSAAATIAAIERVPADTFVQEIAGFLNAPTSSQTRRINQLFAKALSERRLSEAERTELLAAINKVLRSKADREDLSTLLDELDQQAMVKQQYVAALKDYYNSFFRAEEERSLPILQAACQEAEAAAKDKPLSEVLEQLTRGVTITPEAGLKRLTVVPSFWANPYVFPYYTDQHEMVLLYGARPEWSRLVPGPVVPDAAMRTLKALSDPTRVRLLHLLAEKPRPPLELAKSLKLSLPTISHHLTELRLAGLVKLEIGPDSNRTYTLRWREAEAAMDTLKRFIMSSDSNE